MKPIGRSTILIAIALLVAATIWTTANALPASFANNVFDGEMDDDDDDHGPTLFSGHADDDSHSDASEEGQDDEHDDEIEEDDKHEADEDLNHDDEDIDQLGDD